MINESLSKNEYNTLYRKTHVEYHRQKAKENYLLHKDKIRIRNALKRYIAGQNVRRELVEELRANRLIE